MRTLDLKKELKEYYNPTAKEVTLVDVPEMNFIMIDGQGAPESPQFQQSIEALYPIAYTIKFNKKKKEGVDYPVMALEGLWWAEDMSDFDPEKGNRDKWMWTLMIMQPGIVTVTDIETAREVSSRKKSNPALNRVRFQSYSEGKSAQIMHVGPFSEEGPNVQRIHHKIKNIGGRLYGKHHEIYLSDFRRVDPAKMKTVLRQPYQ